MQIVPGKKKGSLLYVYDDYLYYMDSRYNNVFRCNTRRTTKCSGSVAFQDNIVTVLKKHNHPETPFIKAQIEMKEEMLKRSRETHTALKEIFDSVCRRFNYFLFFSVYFIKIFMIYNTIKLKLCDFIIFRYLLHQNVVIYRNISDISDISKFF